MQTIREDLSGIYGLCGLSPYGTRQKKNSNRLHSMSAYSLSGVEFDTLNLTGKWAQLIGKPTAPYRLMIYGKPGSGKSTLALQYAGYLASSQGQKVLYVASEEGLSYTMQEKINRLGVNSPNLQIVDHLPTSTGGYDTIFIDSVNHSNLTPEELRALAGGTASCVFVFQTTKDGTFRGSQEFLHDVDTSIRVEDMQATTEKNRFGAQGSARV